MFTAMGPLIGLTLREDHICLLNHPITKVPFHVPFSFPCDSSFLGSCPYMTPIYPCMDNTVKLHPFTM